MAALSSSSVLSQYEQVLSSSLPIKTSKDDLVAPLKGEASTSSSSSSDRVTELTQPVFNRAFDHISLAAVTPLTVKERVYVTPNEGNQEKTISVMQKYPLAGNVFLSVSGFCGLNLASASGEKTGQAIDYLIIVDSCPRVERFWQGIQSIIRQSSTCIQAWKAIQVMLLAQADVFWPNVNNFPATSIFWVEQEIKDRISWLSSDKKFERIKRIFDADRFVFKRLDLCNRESMRLLARAIKNCGLTLHAGYISNIREYAESEHRLSDFQMSIKELRACMNNQSFLIDTIPRMGGVKMGISPLVQRVRCKIITSDIRLSFPPSPPVPTTSEETHSVK